MKTLIIYTTKYGCVQKVANILKSKLNGKVDSFNIIKENAPPLDEYDNIILGGSIYFGKIQKELTSFITENLSLLLKKRIGLFICAGAPDPQTRCKELESVFPSDLYNHALSKEIFGYSIDYQKLNFIDKLITKAVRGDKSNVSEIYEDRINNFAKVITAK